MKIALLGNMNNSNFCVMRYLRDLGMDAYLLLYTNELEHFTPDCDTNNLRKWEPYIIQTPLTNGSLLKYITTSRKKIRAALKGYDFYIGNGSAPAYFHKADMQLDIFIPYCVGVEWIFQDTIQLKWDTAKNLKSSLTARVKTALQVAFHRPAKVPRALSMMFYKKFQVKGLKQNTRHAISMDAACISTLTQLGVPVENCAIPQLYKLHEYSVDEQQLATYISEMKKARMVLYSHVSHNYKGVIPLFDIKKKLFIN